MTRQPPALSAQTSLDQASLAQASPAPFLGSFLP